MIPGATLYEVHYAYNDYDDSSETSLAFYSTSKEAENHILSIYYEQHSMSARNGPWGNRLVLPIGAWYLARKKWFEEHSFEEINEFFANNGRYADANLRLGEYTIIKYTVATFPKEMKYSLPLEK